MQGPQPDERALVRLRAQREMRKLLDDLRLVGYSDSQLRELARRHDGYELIDELQRLRARGFTELMTTPPRRAA